MPAALAFACHTASLHSACRRPSTSLRGHELRARPREAGGAPACAAAGRCRAGRPRRPWRPSRAPCAAAPASARPAARRQCTILGRARLGACAEHLLTAHCTPATACHPIEPAARRRSSAHHVGCRWTMERVRGPGGRGERAARTSSARRCATRSGVVCCSSSSRVALRRASSAGVTGAGSRHVTSYDFCFSASPACAGSGVSGATVKG